MRITRETLLRVAKETAIKRSLSEPSLAAAYLTGSVLGEDPFLGGSTDIDLVLVHAEEPPLRREIVAVTPDVHLDIRHAHQEEYKNPKELRLHPRLGPELYNPLWLYETRHFLEFVQAAVRTKYHDPANVMGRCRRNSLAARQAWMEMLTTSVDSQPTQKAAAQPTQKAAAQVRRFLEAVALAANAVALLTGNPLSERRFLLLFPPLAQAAGKPELTASLYELTGAAGMDAARMEELLPAWRKDLENALEHPGAEVGISAPRLTYYQSGMTALIEKGSPQAATWPLVNTWTTAAAVLPAGLQGRWKECCDMLGLSGLGLAERLIMLDHFLDDIEELLDAKGEGGG